MKSLEPIFPSRLDLPVGEYQAEVASKIEVRSTGELIVLFRLTEPEDEKNPQAGLGGRIARAWFVTKHENPVTQEEGLSALGELLSACGVVDLDDALGCIIRIRLARVVMRSDPSRSKVAAVEFLPLSDLDVKPYVTP